LFQVADFEQAGVIRQYQLDDHEKLVTVNYTYYVMEDDYEEIDDNSGRFSLFKTMSRVAKFITYLRCTLLLFLVDNY